MTRKAVNIVVGSVLLISIVLSLLLLANHSSENGDLLLFIPFMLIFSCVFFFLGYNAVDYDHWMKQKTTAVHFPYYGSVKFYKWFGYGVAIFSTLCALWVFFSYVIFF